MRLIRDISSNPSHDRIVEESPANFSPDKVETISSEPLQSSNDLVRRAPSAFAGWSSTVSEAL